MAGTPLMPLSVQMCASIYIWVLVHTTPAQKSGPKLRPRPLFEKELLVRILYFKKELLARIPYFQKEMPGKFLYLERNS